jgi:hypothetical protein
MPIGEWDVSVHRISRLAQSIGDENRQELPRFLWKNPSAIETEVSSFKSALDFIPDGVGRRPDDFVDDVFELESNMGFPWVLLCRAQRVPERYRADLAPQEWVVIRAWDTSS